MKSFSSNLYSFMESRSLSHEDIIDLSGIDFHKLMDIQYDSFLQPSVDPRDYYIFCINMDIDYTTIYSDTGFETTTLYSKYDKYPTDLQLIVTQNLITKLANKCFPKGNKSDRKKLLEDFLMSAVYSEGVNIRGAFVGIEPFTAHTLFKLKSSIDEYLNSHNYFEVILGILMYSKIVNYNYNLAKDVYGLSYVDIAKYLGLSTSCVSNWGGNYCMNIPSKYVEQLSIALGNFSEREFRTTILSRKDFTRPCLITSSIALESSHVENIPVDRGEIKNSDNKPKDITDLVDSTESLLRSGSNNENKTTVVPVEISDELLIKMFNSLPEESQVSIKKQICTLFLVNQYCDT